MANMAENDVMIDIKAMLAKEVSPLTPECCIYKVPYQIRKLKEDAYTPRVVSIGPMHFGNSRLQHMEIHKQIYFQRFIQRTQTDMDKLVDKVKELEPRVRRCYSENIKLSDRELIKVILVDAIFILELLLTFNKLYHDWEEHDKILLKPWLRTNIMLDFILLENQLPFFVLVEIFNLAFSSHQRACLPSLLTLAFGYFDYYNISKVDPNPNTPIKHFTDMLRTFYLQPSSRRPPIDKPPINLHSATTLLEAGVEFMVNKEGTCLLDLKLSGRALKIPEFRVEDWTETVYSNIVALEQCHYPYESYFTDYIVVLDDLINTGEDVDVLVKSEIIQNWLSDSNNAVANLFNGLAKNITETKFNSSYHKIYQDLNDIHDSRINNLIATLRRDYGKTPWQAAASFAAVILLVLTVIQTVFAIFQIAPKKG